MDKVEKSLVSIVIPTYNHANYLNAALQSILNQTYSKWEAIVVDNYSTDNTDEVMGRFNDSRISHIKINNKGVIAASRNAGLAMAKGEWIAFLDSDDLWTAEKLEVCLDSANSNVDLIYHDLKLIAKKRSIFQSKTLTSWQVRAPITVDLVERGNAIATSSVVIRSDLIKRIGGMNESPIMIGAEDYNTWLRVSGLTNGFKYIHQKLGYYRLHDKGISTSKDMSLPMEEAVREFKPLLSKKQLDKFQKRISYIKGRYNYLLGNYAFAKEELKRSVNWININNSLKAIWMIFSMTIYGKR